jgi:hypothetical protein
MSYESTFGWRDLCFCFANTFQCINLLTKGNGMKQKLLIAALAMLGSVTAHAGAILIVNNSAATSEPGTTDSVTDNLQALHLAVGNTVTITSDIPASLAGYSQVWDVSFSNNGALTAAGQSLYLGFLQGGGGLFLMGENSGFMGRNDSIFSLIAAAGGGSIGFSSACGGSQVVHAPFTGPNAVASVNYAAPGCFDGNGTGEWITSNDGDLTGAGIAFGVGDLANAAAGALTSILDVNFMMNDYDLPHSQNLTKNLIGFVGDQVNPPNGVPEPATLALVGLGLLGWGAVRRKA